MYRWLACLGLLSWMAGTVLTIVAQKRGVVAEAVVLRLADNTPIHGTLYSPRSDATDLPAAVVLHATALTHESCAPGLSIPLARDGYLVLAIDLRGHGRSGGGVAPGEFCTDHALSAAPARFPEVEAAIDFLKSHPRCCHGYTATIWEGDTPLEHLHLNRIALIGHSRGGLAAAQVGQQRADVDSVVCIGAAPAMCDPVHPRNLLILAGTQEELIDSEQFVMAFESAGGGFQDAGPTFVGEFKRGTARRLRFVSDVTHMNALASPGISRSVVEWVGAAFDYAAGRNSGWYVLASAVGVLAATLGGLLVVTVVLARLAHTLRTPKEPQRWHLGRLALLGLLVGATGPLVVRLAPWLDLGPVYFVGPAVALLGGVALVCLFVATGVPPAAGAPAPTAAHWRGAFLGLVALLLGFLWLGVPWGMSYAAVVPAPHRLLLAVALVPLLFPTSLLLAYALGRLTEGSASLRAALGRALVWLTVPVVLWVTTCRSPLSGYPLFLVPASLIAASFVVALPLWLLPARRGLCLARAIAHAGGAAWLLACSLPFIDG